MTDSQDSGYRAVLEGQAETLKDVLDLVREELDKLGRGRWIEEGAEDEQEYSPRREWESRRGAAEGVNSEALYNRWWLDTLEDSPADFDRARRLLQMENTFGLILRDWEHHPERALTWALGMILAGPVRTDDRPTKYGDREDAEKRSRALRDQRAEDVLGLHLRKTFRPGPAPENDVKIWKALRSLELEKGAPWSKRGRAEIIAERLGMNARTVERRLAHMHPWFRP